MNKAIEMLRAQQEKVEERSAPWMVAEQLIDICVREPGCADILAEDLQNAGMGIVEAEKKINAFADENRTGPFACVTPVEADRILRQFYGLPEAGAGVGVSAGGGVALDLGDFL